MMGEKLMIRKLSICRMESKRIQTIVDGESLTRQDQAEMCNINVIYAKTQRGEIVMASRHHPEYGDFSQAVTYDEALNQINDAKEAFNDLPSSERKKYNFSPEQYYEEVTSTVNAKIKAHQDKKAEEKAAKKAQNELEKAQKLVADNTPKGE
ncbi:MAG: internal scaffolding protein [Microviridae sp.]|nr:MAG: internal scaffolding protein [Microviridae sp.]